ncbi:FGGY family carbohydrate kinase [Asticcacaulis sp. BYS171W]|uniref:ATP:glycerol 3-phosphotransferase n=1 Tax=Asticcacaulis aquaticus TaxID=2984212 RepID=A0ABT5HVS1_9CAUL|nr:FGGY family carbohydrate kinase [Asticcacaulis aquaticus]MDC7684163.1 FGGY family carbohydrate kinase [Asticcacaulis aquaticus]
MSASPLILAIDQGTTNSKAFLIDPQGGIVAKASRPMTVTHPQPGWAELDPCGIWQTVRETIDEVSAGRDVAAIAISNQRESILLWDAATGEPVGPCVIWQCRRSSDACALLREYGHEAMIVEKTGLGIDPLFPALKLAWLLDNLPDARVRAERGELRAGTVDSWLLWNLTGGKVHATDASNASRTQLMNIDTGRWDADLAELFRLPVSLLPEIKASDALFGHTADGVPIHALMGDSHAALFGHGISTPGRIKATLGTGSSLMAVTGARAYSTHGLSGTVAWSRHGDVVHALEGNISVSGQAAAFATRLLNLANEAALTELAKTLSDNGGVVFVPALAGLGAPHWKDRARGQITGMTLATEPAHVARAALEAIALQIRDVFVAMEADLGAELPDISVDGGAAASDVLMQILADLLNRPVRRPAVTEVTACGVARMAGEALGLWQGRGDTEDTVFTPRLNQAARTQILSQWYAAIEKAKQE